MVKPPRKTPLGGRPVTKRTSDATAAFMGISLASSDLYVRRGVELRKRDQFKVATFNADILITCDTDGTKVHVVDKSDTGGAKVEVTRQLGQ